MSTDTDDLQSKLNAGGTVTREMQCIICERTLEPACDIESQPYGAGCCEISFHFGACKFDQMKGFHNNNDPNSASLAERLAACGLIEFFMCEECFEKKAALFRGYHIEKITNKRRVI